MNFYGYYSTTVDPTNPTTGWTGDTYPVYSSEGSNNIDWTVAAVVNHPGDTGRQRIQEALEHLNIDQVAIVRALAARDAHLDMQDWLHWRVPERKVSLPRGRAVPCAEQRRCPARNPLARVSRAPIVAYRADVR